MINIDDFINKKNKQENIIQIGYKLLIIYTKY